MNDTKKFIIYSPIILAIVMVIGILIGSRTGSDGQHEQLTIYPKSNKLSAVLDLIEADYVDSVDRDVLIDKTIPALLDNLDPHSIYIPAKELSEHTEPLEGNFEGIGIEFNMKNDTLLVLHTISGGPSEKLGIMPGDRIVTINDSVFAGVKMTTEDIMKNLKGPKGTKVKVGIKRGGVNELIEYEITRDKIPIYSIDVAIMLTDEIGYIKIDRFAKTTYDEFLEAIQKLDEHNYNKLIIDLRGNGGGYLEMAKEIADEFLKEGNLIVYTKGRSRPVTNYFATAKNSCRNKEVAVLIDQWTASASEILAGALQDNDIGTIIGRRSFGKGLVQEPTMFRDGSAMRLTIARYYTPTGRCIQKPYNHGTKNYYLDIKERFVHGEFEQADSTKFNDSLKYLTPKGKKVYGGGGIMPDIFVPVDTSGVTDYLINARDRGLIYRFALNYADKNRNTLNKFKDYRSINEYLEKQNLIEQFIKFAEQNKLKKNKEQIQESYDIIDTQLKANIARNTAIDNEGYWPIIKDIDNILQKAIEILSE